MKQALLIIDVQNDYFAGGKMALYQPEMALRHINQLEERFLQESLPIIYIQHIKHVANANFFGAGTLGAELHPQLKVNEQAIIIEKQFPNSFLGTSLLEVLQNLKVEQLVVTGMMTHMCVDSTTRAATELGLQPLLITDATATRALQFAGRSVSAENVQLSFLSALTNFASLQTTKEFLGNSSETF